MNALYLLVEYVSDLEAQVNITSKARLLRLEISLWTITFFFMWPKSANFCFWFLFYSPFLHSSFHYSTIPHTSFTKTFSCISFQTQVGLHSPNISFKGPIALAFLYIYMQFRSWRWQQVLVGLKAIVLMWLHFQSSNLSNCDYMHWWWMPYITKFFLLLDMSKWCLDFFKCTPLGLWNQLINKYNSHTTYDCKYEDCPWNDLPKTIIKLIKKKK